MARYKIPYTTLNDSLKHLRVQIIDSLPYTVKNLPRFETPEEVFNYCKKNFQYQSDPQGVELFQSVPTLLENGGRGDCDCATIFVLAMLLNSGFTNCGIVLTGRNKLNPSHIYAYNINEKDEKQFLDLTNKNFNQVRPYPFKQCIPFKISKNQLDMFLQLADNGNRRRKRKRVIKANRQTSVFIPSKNIYLPFEQIDKLPIKKAKQTLLSEGYAIEQLSEYLSGRAERKARKQARTEKKASKAEFKKEKRAQKIEKQKAKTEIKKARAEKKRAQAEKKIMQGEAKKTRAEAKRIKAEKRGEGEESDGMKIFNRAGEMVAKVASSKIRGEEGEKEEQDENITDAEIIDEEENEIETAPEIIEAEEQTEIETDLQDGKITLTNSDYLGLGLFFVGAFLEKTKRV